jgi:poly(glycerol-phosphate) alpha-glucosyltransferase
MRIAGLIDTISRNAGGLNSSVRRLAQSMAELGDEIAFVTVEDAKTSEDSREWAPIPIQSARPRGPRRLGFAPSLESQLLAFDADLLMVHGIWTYTSRVSLRWQKKTHRPAVIHAHGMLDPWAVRNSHWKKRLAGWAYENEHLRRAACLRALCEAEAAAMRTFGLKNPIAILPNAIDLPALKEGVESNMALFCGRKVLLYLGRMHPKKGLANLLRAWKQATSAGAESWVLAVAGWDEAGHEAELQRLASELALPWSKVCGDSFRSVSVGGPPSVVFMGPRFGRAKAELYRACDTFVLPSLSEGLPMVVLEAWAFAKPVLMTQECNIPEGFAEEAAIRIEPNVASIARGLSGLFEMSQSSRAAMGAKGRELVARRFTWARVAREMRSVYQWVLGGGPKPDCVVTP